MNHKATLFWITGLSGAGKTTLGTALAKKLRAQGESVIFLDGDILRDVFNNSFGHDANGRYEAAKQYARLCKMLVEQSIHVICATISLFHEVQNWNRLNIKNYLEIFLDISLDELIVRNNKKIYSNTNIVGVDIEAEFPKNPDIILKTQHLDENISKILNHYSKENYNAANHMELY